MKEKRDLPLTILAWMAVLGVLFFILHQVWHTVIIFILAGVLSYMLFPAVKFLERFMSRFLAVVIVYITLICGVGTFIYLILSVAVFQVNLLIPTIQKLFIPGASDQVAPIFALFSPFGVSHDTVMAIGQDLAKYFEQFLHDLLPLLSNLLDSVLNTFLIIIMSIYLILDGERIAAWLKNKDNIPLAHIGKVEFFLKTLQRVIGAYIHGQLLLSLIIGVLVGVGMMIFQVPYALLLGVLAFIMAFVPVLGTFISGAACILLALTKGWLVALLVLGYFVCVHIIEADIFGPRIVGRALGLHPLVSLLAIIAGSELFGIVGALFAAPISGLAQAIFIAFWKNWKKRHEEQFARNNSKR